RPRLESPHARPRLPDQRRTATAGAAPLADVAPGRRLCVAGPLAVGPAAVARRTARGTVATPPAPAARGRGAQPGAVLPRSRRSTAGGTAEAPFPGPGGWPVRVRACLVGVDRAPAARAGGRRTGTSRTRARRRTRRDPRLGPLHHARGLRPP